MKTNFTPFSLSRLLLLLLFCGAATFLSAQPLNDLCINAEPIIVGSTVPGTTVAATFDNVGFCGTSNTAPGVWYSVTTASEGILTASTCNNANYDTKISVFGGSCGVFSCLGGNDDGPGCSGFTSEVSVIIPAAGTYLILVHGFGTATGTFNLSTTFVAPLGNDACSGAEPITAGSPVLGSTTDASVDNVGFCGTSNTAPGVWYSYTPAEDGCVTITTCSPNTNYDTKLSVFTDGCGTLTCVDGNDDDFGCANSGLQSLVTAQVSGGTEYLILVHGFGAASGDFELTVDFNTAPANDDVCGAEAIALGAAIPVDLSCATAQVGEVSPGAGTGVSTCNSQDGWCSFETEVQNSLWYTFIAPPSGAVLASASGADMQLAIWSAGDCADFGSFVEIVANDDGGPGLEPASVTCSALLTPGETYYVQLDGFGGANPINAVLTVTEIDLIVSLAEASCTDEVIVATVTGDGIGTLSFQSNATVTDNGDGTFNLTNFNVGDEVFFAVVDDLNGAVDGTSCVFSDTVFVADTEAPTFVNCEPLVVEAPLDQCDAVVTFDAPMAVDEVCNIPRSTEVEVVLTLLTDNFPQETSWNLFGPGGEVVASRAAGFYTAAGSTFTETFTLPSGDYEFVIADAFGDGICCTFGQGNYAIDYTDETGVQSFPSPSGGAFGNSETLAFTVVAPAAGPSPVTVTQIDGPVSGSVFPIGSTTVTFEAVDSAGLSTTCSFEVIVTFNEPELGCISDINVTLNENCQAMLIPEMVLAGNTSCLTDLYTFNIVVMDDDPSNGPIIDGCGTFQYTITEPDPIATPTAPDPIVGFTGAFAEANWTVVEDNDGDPGDMVSVAFTATDLVLNTSTTGTSTIFGNTPFAEASYMFSETGTLTFDYDYVTNDGGFDAFIIDFEGEMTPVDISGQNSTNGDVTADIAPGDMLVVRVSEDDGALSTINQLTISNFLFTFPTPTSNEFNLDNFTSCWGFVNAEDKTSPRITDSIVAPEELFCVDLATISLNALPANVSRCFNVDSEGNVPVNFYNTALGQRLARGSATGQIPGFFDGCSSMEICVNDLIPAVDPCDDVVITRVYTATDGDCPSVSGESNAPTVFTYQIIFTRPDVDSVQSSATLAEFSCSDVLTLLPINQFGNQNPVPAVEDYPFVVRADGTPIYLDETFCNLGATFEDGPRIVTCANTYKFVRTWTVIDWCEVSNIRTFTQLVKVGDFDAPVITPPTQDLNFDGVADAYPLFYSTNTSDCRSIFIIPAGSATDACDNAPTVSAVIYPFGDTLALGFGPYAVGSPTFDGIPRGTHTIRYTATDDCGNESILDVPVTIGDATAPVAICEDGLNISIGGPIGPQGGSAQLCADDIDAASYDDCSDVQLRITRVDAENRPIDANGNLVIPAQNAYVNCITLTCADLGNVRVSLRVTDDGNDDGLFQFGIDNSNFCWLDVLVEDKTAPICIAPAPQTINCNDLSGEFPDDLNLAVVTDPEGTFALLNDQFGAATGLDNCPDPVVTQSVVDNRNSCGVGTIVRTFTVTDGEGFTSPPNCGQVITVQAVHDYTVVFPGDQESDQCIEPDYNAVTYTEFGCDLLTISTSIDTFSATADECYKLRITYEVLNWCEYNTLDAPYMIPRDADNDGILNNDTTVLHVIPRNAGPGDDLAYLDRDVNRANFNSIGNLDTGDGGILPGSEAAGYGNDGSRGAFLYQQFIKVYDDTPPTLVVTEPDSAFCSFAADCTGDVELTYAIDDECSPESVDATVELDAFVNPGADGVYTLADFVADGGNVTSLVTNNGDGTYTVNLDNLPIGEHAIRIRVTDGCGNVAVDLIEFEVVDCKAPTPICINGLTVTLMPDGTGGGMAAIWVSDFIASPSTDCSGPVEFAIYLDGEQPAVPSGLDTGLVLDCSLVGPQTIRIYAIDQEGNADYCLTTLMVQVFNSDVCTGPGSDGSLAGVVISTMDEMMDAVAVNISGQSGMTDTELTTTGLYQFTGLALGDDYTVEPTHDPSINLARVSTGDIILISRHILGLQEMTGTYQLKAGDVTQDDNLNILDIIAIRRVILGLDLSFSATNSWRFYVAGDDQFAETYTENNLAGAVSAPDFIAVEMGNVTDAANAFTGSAEDGGRSLKTIEIEEQALEAGNTYAVTLRAGDLAGFQGTLQLGSGLELTNVNYAALQAGNVNLSKVSEGLIAFSYESKEAAGTELLTLEVRATVNAQLSELLSLTDRITRSEAYTTNDELARLGLDFATTATAGEVKFALEQNSPNPFVDQTQVRFTLPSAATVQLTIQNQQGQLLRTLEIDAAAGANQITVGREQLNGATGVLTYTLVAGEFVATRKMIVQ